MSARITDPDVCRIAGKLGPLTRDGAAPDVIAKTRQDLERAKRIAALRVAIRKAPSLTSDELASFIAALRAIGRPR